MRSNEKTFGADQPSKRMPTGKVDLFICACTREACRYEGCRRAFCLLEAAKGDRKSAEAAEDALRAYLYGVISEPLTVSTLRRGSKKRRWEAVR